MKKIAIFLVIITAFFIGISNAEATKMTVARLPEPLIANLIIGKWSFIGETKEGILVKAVIVFGLDGQAEFSITAYSFGLPVLNRKISSHYSIGDVNGKSYLFLNPGERAWVTAEIISLEFGRMKLREISNSSNILGISYPALWERIASPTE
ncbi:MAG: hypothetical protein UU85_C0001G0128 [Candidatus Wolfebacteria bacterium GW2011_GWA2_42_10]|uniref:Uncharacterized protein n=2 Tax=Candidatus Wolfeibacteriota TaxID=1752735 RepID=A0A0G1AKB7_9BACT|nr:MAG: hypothetical protein UU38_C0003G0188 [Candidatus Wolfebacteria bacterium GW2011_GWB1_41_12]KKS25698.1 MAG: hypothetical protein UU85_C0001G0128 [Candidatus Wolfebacteria bacterium GW2011_GWA2_42_10]KKT56370.1 MAG: hypothetical protein UW50_C0002G0047 [Candidatus Wolfebacteria bacterium GW2011_GWA1_44_24]